MATQGYEDGWWYSADGLRLHYRDYAGDPGKAPILCIPGLTRNARDFEGVAARLAGTRRVIAVDLRGRGESEHAADPMSYGPPAYLQDLAGLIAARQLPRVVVFGTSLGGLLAMLMAVTMRKNLAGVLLNDIGPVLNEAGIARIRAYVGRDDRFPDWDAAARAIAINHAGTFPDHTHDDWLTWAHRLCRKSDDGIRFDYDLRIAEPFNLPPPEPAVDLWPAFAALAGLPALLVRGERSDVLAADTASEMVRRNPEMALLTLPRTGHAPTLEEPEAIAATDRLLRQVDE